MKAEKLHSEINFRLGEIRENMVFRRNKFLDLSVVMATGLRLKDMLDRAINFIPWKARIFLILQENELWDIVNSTAAHYVTVPTVAADKVAFDKQDIKAKRTILDDIKDHVIPPISGKDYAHQMWTALTNLYQSSNENQKNVVKGEIEEH